MKSSDGIVSKPIEIVPADLGDSAHRQAIVELLDMYSRDPMGNAGGLPQDTRENLIEGLGRQRNALILLARRHDSYIGLCICFQGFSTFRAQPLLNIHDIAVHPEYRDQGVGRQLLAAVETAARENNCCRITLEVRIDNPAARHLYQSFGFADTDPPMHFWHKNLGS